MIDEYIKSIITAEVPNAVRAVLREIIEDGTLAGLMAEVERRRLLTAHEVAEMLNFHVVTIYRLKREGKLPFVSTGTRTFGFDPDEIERITKDGICSN